MAMKRLLPGKHIEIHIVYVSAYAPVDEWEMLKKPLQLNEKNPQNMQIYYLDEQHFTKEREKLGKAIGLMDTGVSENPAVTGEEADISRFKAFLSKSLYDKRNETQNILSFVKPLFTYLLLFINIAIFLLLEIGKGSENIENLIKHGASYNPAIMWGLNCS